MVGFSAGWSLSITTGRGRTRTMCARSTPFFVIPKAKRKKDQVAVSLRRIAEDAKADRNLMPAILEAVKSYASVGEICDVFREVYGIYRDPANY